MMASTQEFDVSSIQLPKCKKGLKFLVNQVRIRNYVWQLQRANSNNDIVFTREQVLECWHSALTREHAKLVKISPDFQAAQALLDAGIEQGNTLEPLTISEHHATKGILEEVKKGRKEQQVDDPQEDAPFLASELNRSGLQQLEAQWNGQMPSGALIENKNNCMQKAIQDVDRYTRGGRLREIRIEKDEKRQPKITSDLNIGMKVEYDIMLDENTDVAMSDVVNDHGNGKALPFMTRRQGICPKKSTSARRDLRIKKAIQGGQPLSKQDEEYLDRKKTVETLLAQKYKLHGLENHPLSGIPLYEGKAEAKIRAREKKDIKRLKWAANQVKDQQARRDKKLQKRREIVTGGVADATGAIITVVGPKPSRAQMKQQARHAEMGMKAQVALEKNPSLIVAEASMKYEDEDKNKEDGKSELMSLQLASSYHFQSQKSGFGSQSGQAVSKARDAERVRKLELQIRAGLGKLHM